MYIETMPTKKSLSAFGGSLLINRLIIRKNLRTKLSGILPARNNLDKFENLLLGFTVGAQCLDDMSWLSQDPAIAAIIGRNYCPKSYGDFLRDFKPHQIKETNEILSSLAFTLRKDLGLSKSITIDLDSTQNQQYAKKMEGVCRNYKGFEGLETIQAFDELGLQYWNDVTQI